LFSAVDGGSWAEELKPNRFPIMDFTGFKELFSITSGDGVSVDRIPSAELETGREE